MNVTVGLMAGFGTWTAPAQTIGTDLGDTRANFDDPLSGDGALADEVETCAGGGDRAGASA
jgi:hypothetical protein